MTHLFTQAWNDLVSRAKKDNAIVALRIQHVPQTITHLPWYGEEAEYGILQASLGMNEWEDVMEPVLKQRYTRNWLHRTAHVPLVEENTRYHRLVSHACLAYTLLKKNGIDAHITDEKARVHLAGNGNYEALTNLPSNN